MRWNVYFSMAKTNIEKFLANKNLTGKTTRKINQVCLKVILIPGAAGAGDLRGLQAVTKT